MTWIIIIILIIFWIMNIRPREIVECMNSARKRFIKGLLTKKMKHDAVIKIEKEDGD